jgi:hypothetical protein
LRTRSRNATSRGSRNDIVRSRWRQEWAGRTTDYRGRFDNFASFDLRAVASLFDLVVVFTVAAPFAERRAKIPSQPAANFFVEPECNTVIDN